MTFEIDHEAETLRVLANSEYAEQIDDNFGITKFQLEALRLLATNNEHKFSEAQKKLLQEFIIKSMGDLDFNAKLKQIQAMSLRDTGLSGAMIGNMIYFTFKTRRANQFPDIFQRLDKNQNRIINNMELDDEHRITLGEYSIFYDMIRLRRVFDDFDRRIEFDQKSELGQLHQKIQKGERLQEQMEKVYTKDVNTSPGMLVFDNTLKKSLIIGKALGFFEKLIKNVITKFGHASKLFKNKKKSAKLSHINPGPLEDDFSLRDYLYSTVYQIQVDKIISSENKKVLKEMYGDNWLDIVNEKYAKIERHIHDDTVGRYSGLSAQAENEQYKAGAASLLPFGLGHKKFRKTDFSEIHRQMLDSHYRENQGKMLCSEFVAKATIASLMELNNSLKAEAEFQGKSFTGDVIKIPISQRERLDRMHPQRLLDVLKGQGCVKKIKRPNSVQQYFKKGKSKVR